VGKANRERRRAKERAKQKESKRRHAGRLGPDRRAEGGAPAGQQSEPGQSGPGQSGPGQSGSGQSGPGQSGSGQSGPGQSGPGQSGPGQSGRPGHSANAASTASSGAAPPSAAELAADVAAKAVQALSDGDAAAYRRCVAELAGRPAIRGWWRTTEQVLTAALERSVTAAWRLGWQPADVVRAIGRELGGAHAQVAGDAVAAEIRGYPASTVDDRWRAQLTALGARAWWAGDDGYLSARGGMENLSRAAVIARALEVIFVLGKLPRLPTVGSPPGTARPGRAAPGQQTSQPRAADERMLTRIRALLAKAESTEFPEEAEALSARAQELMARHSIDQALVNAASDRRDQPEAVRLPVDNPYEAPKAVLLDVVASANRCRSVWHRKLGFATVFGFAADLGAVELLFTSLLVQATAAMLHAGARRDAYGRSRTRSFRSSFLAAYAQRIGERLQAAADEATTQAVAETTGTNLLPVLAARDQAVDRAVDETFPELSEHRVAGGRNYEGWISGRAAADLASLTTRAGITRPCA